MKELRAEMLSVARGERKAPAGARQASFESVEAVMRLLTPENRQLLAAIEREKPATGAGRTKVPEVAIHRLTVDIDLCRQTDRVAVA